MSPRKIPASKVSAHRERRYRENDTALFAAQKEAERRERILATRRRVEAKWRPKIPEVRKVNFENFKNRYHDIDEPDYAIDVLMAGPNLQAQIRREQACRRKEENARARQKYMLALGELQEREPGSRAKHDAQERLKREKRAEASQPSGAEIERIRIQSQPILGHLTSLLQDTEQRSTPRTFVRPFKALIYYHPQMKDILNTLEEKWADDYEEMEVESEEPAGDPREVEIVESLKDDGSNSENEDDDDDNDDDDDDDVESEDSIDSNAEDLDSIMDSPEALRDMRCYVNFIENEVIPLYDRFAGAEVTKVKHSDLWSLFRVGDLIYMPSSGEPAGRYHEVWRIYRIQVPEPEASYPSKLAWEFLLDEFQQEDDSAKFKIYAYYIDHDGNSFGAVRHIFEIDSFTGERPIESLEVYPLRYRQDQEAILESLKQQGRDFQRFLTDRHQSYNAWTLTRNPPFDNSNYASNGNNEEEILCDDNYNKMRHPEFVESDVMVDLAEAFQKNPEWRPTFHKPAVNKSIRCEAENDEMEIQQWLDGSRQRLAFSQPEIVQKADGVETRQRREYLSKDAFLRQRAKGITMTEANLKDQELREEDIVLLPKRMFAYALRERRFIAVNTHFLKPIRRVQGVFDNLRIQKEYKDIVRGLVASHFQKKNLERRFIDESVEWTGQDLIQNKGRGLVVLLHGVPGVGKTATAEAVAMDYRKPLFVITCGDLGLTPDEVESRLNNVFRLAHLWDCVLLLDEADVFLSQRSKTDMERNALVSVFLRVLEYYNGLLFLTTNRLGAIDEAFKSRIHMSLYYPPLDKQQTRDIFQLNLANLRESEGQRRGMTDEPTLVIKDNEILEFADRHYEDNARSTSCWNGRQIRNAFQIASGLAYYKYEEAVRAARSRGAEPPSAPVLDRSLFEAVQMSTQSFDRHMKESKRIDGDILMRNDYYDEGR